jgi:homoaconitase/3-isopropylmalate dehydratase large subunit
MTSFETYMNLRIICNFLSKKSMKKIVRYVMAPSKNDVYNQMSDNELQKLFLRCYSKDIYCEQIHK